jgi:hypothetical protein
MHTAGDADTVQLIARAICFREVEIGLLETTAAAVRLVPGVRAEVAAAASH